MDDDPLRQGRSCIQMGTRICIDHLVDKVNVCVLASAWHPAPL